MIALMYHDVVTDPQNGASGFPGRDAARYKIAFERFRQHLEAIARSTASTSATAPALTFDDGGASGVAVADELERRGLRGHFFITTNYIGTPGFLTALQIRELAARGHVIGSHSCSHPLRMGHASWSRLLDEWTTSRNLLTEIIGTVVTMASVPGGDFTRRVAAAATEAGYARLFTSEPTRASRCVSGLTICGRFTVMRWTSAATVCAAARGAWRPWTSQAFLWTAKKIGKRLGREHYIQARRLLIGYANDVRWGDQR